MEIEIRPLQSYAEQLLCLDLQKETWGEDFAECVPPSIQQITQKMGGIVAGAFQPDGGLAAFVLGVTGLRKGRLAHWSHMLAVRPALRDRGLGRKLKLYQRHAMIQMGVKFMYWTYDPLVARNAHLNLNRLGATVDEYVEDMYAGMSSSLHEGLGTDRFVLEWDLASSHVEDLASSEKCRSAEAEELGPVVNAHCGQDGAPVPAEADLPAVDQLRVEIPLDIQQAKKASIQAGRQWRVSTRRAFQHYLKLGYCVQGFRRDPVGNRCWYCLSKVSRRDPEAAKRGR